MLGLSSEGDQLAVLANPSFAVRIMRTRKALNEPLRIRIQVMAALNKMSLAGLEDLAAKLRHAIARHPAGC